MTLAIATLFIIAAVLAALVITDSAIRGCNAYRALVRGMERP